MKYHIADKVAAIQSATTIQTLLEVIEEITKEIGFEYFSYGHRSHTPLSAPKLDLINNYPDNWQNTYKEKRYFEQDPTIIHALRSTSPLIWDDETFTGSRTLQEDASQFGIDYGWSQATRSTSGVSMLTLVRAQEPMSDSEIQSNAPSLMWLTHVINEAIEKFIDTNLELSEVILTSRESEVIRWTADGKTSYEISVILGISERTVNFHLNNVMVKLKSHNKISATVKAMALSLI